MADADGATNLPAARPPAAGTGFAASNATIPKGARAYPAEMFPGWSVSGEGTWDTILDATPLKDAGYGTLVAYMLRRFGPPDQPGDPYKDLCAGWFLDTPDPDVFVLVRPSVVDPSFSFVVFMTSAEPPGRDGRRQDDPRLGRIAGAYRSTLLDLLRPVGVRDSHIDARGTVDPDEFVPDDVTILAGHGDASGDDDEDIDDEGPDFEAGRHPTSCTAIPAAMISGDGWGDLVAMARELGGGDMTAGRDILVDIAATAILARAADVDRDARILSVARLDVLRRPDMVARVPLDDEGMAAASALSAELPGLARAGAEHPMLTDAVVGASSSLMARVGIGDGLAKALRAARFEREWVAVAQDIWDAVGSGFDEGLLPACEADVGAFPGSIREAGHGDAADIADAALARDGGGDILGMAVHAMRATLRRQAQERAVPAIAP